MNKINVIIIWFKLIQLESGSIRTLEQSTKNIFIKFDTIKFISINNWNTHTLNNYNVFG